MVRVLVLDVTNRGRIKAVHKDVASAGKRKTLKR